MKTIPMTLSLLAALALLAGCSKSAEPGDHDAHAEAKSPAGKKMCTEHNLPEDECGICHP